MAIYYLELAMRRCRRSPAMVALLALTMAIGIAACITALTIFSALAGEPLPGISNHLYVVTMDAREQPDKLNPAYSFPSDLLKLQDAKTLVDAHRASAQVAVALADAAVGSLDGTHSDMVSGLLAYGPVLKELGVPLQFGRPWTEAELASRAPVAIIDTKLAIRLFGSADVVGQSVKIGDHQFRVVGVTAPWKPRTQFIDARPNAGPAQTMQIFLPIGAALDAGIGPTSSGKCDGNIGSTTFGSVAVQNCRWLEVWVALKTIDEKAAYQNFLVGYADTQHDSGRFLYQPQAKLYGARAWMEANRVVPNDVTLNVILAGTFLVLCMINVSGLLTARFLRRRADVAIRRALGASWWQVFSQHLVESCFLGLLGGSLALPLTLFGMWVVRKQPVSYAPAAHFSLGVFGLLFVLSIVIGMIVGVLPAWRVCRLSPALQMKQE